MCGISEWSVCVHYTCVYVHILLCVCIYMYTGTYILIGIYVFIYSKHKVIIKFLKKKKRMRVMLPRKERLKQAERPKQCSCSFLLHLLSFGAFRCFCMYMHVDVCGWPSSYSMVVLLKRNLRGGVKMVSCA